MLSRSLRTCGLIAAAGVLGYSYKCSYKFYVKDKFMWSTISAKCKDTRESSVPNPDLSAWRDKDYCFYCGRGGSSAGDSSSVPVGKVDGKSSQQNSSELLDAVDRARGLIESVMVEWGVPGCVVAVMKDGKCIWSEGLGIADVENDVPCSPKSVMRIASISKSLSAVALLQLYQRGLVDLDAPVQKYVPEFPEKTYNGEKVNITLRLLMSHLSGIRHYKNKDNANEGGEKLEKKMGEFSFSEYYIKRHYSNIKDSLKLFSEDDLICKPGSEYHYSTHAWTLVSAVIENVSGMPFIDYMKKFVLDPLGMSATEAELHKKIIKGRAKHYFRRSNGSLCNVPYVDLSYKWAGGGYVSNAKDLVKLGNSILNCWHQASRNNMEMLEGLKGDALLQPSTTKLMLKTNVINVDSKMANSSSPPPNPPIGYGLGWFVRPAKKGLSGGRDYPLMFFHTGGAVGACSYLGIFPGQPTDSGDSSTVPVSSSQSRGVVVAMLFNLQEMGGLIRLGQRVAEEFVNIH